MNYKTLFFFISLATFLLVSCTNDDEDTVIPKPKGYYRIDFPQKTYYNFDSALYCSFSLPQYAYAEIDTKKKFNNDTGKFAKSNPQWLNIIFPKYNATINLTHLTINNNLASYLDDAHFFALSKHQVKATGIEQTVIIRDSAKVYGLLFDIEGNTASNVQFYLTDSTKHFLRGALYFNSVPNIDSLNVVIDYLRKDILKLINTTKWKN
ncbi:MAG: gliding motility lipoprotein GldD [Bacteroidetes bacterium]|nr:gliding motility lipoprotein GldD [Bacteroidota bacterium]